jgi:F5/8 type C domain
MTSLHPLLLAALLASAAGAQNVNVALGGTATQTSFLGFGEQPGYAIDGNRDGYWWNSSCTVTGNVAGASWQVVLATPSLVNEVVIWNRSDCCGNRLSSFRVDVLDGSTVVFQQSFHTDGSQVPNGDYLRVKIPGAGVNATAVRLSNVGINAEGTRILQFAEVEVIRYGTGREINFARYGTTTASSNPSTAARAIDGSSNGYEPALAAWRSAAAANQWLQVACERHRVDAIRLWPVTYGQGPISCGNFRVGVWDNGVEVWGTNLLPSASMPINLPTVVTPPNGTFGDAIRVSTLGPVNGTTQLVLAELESVMFAGYIGEQWQYGAGCRVGSTVPRLDNAVRPTTGANLSMTVSAVPTNGLGLLVTGLSASAFGALPLPFELTPLGAPHCWALTSLDATSLATTTTGTLTFPFAIPTTSGTLGTRLFQQAVVYAPATNAFGFVVSNALEQFIGF